MDEQYLGLIRNYFRLSWLLLFLFGASPALDKNFMGLSTSSPLILQKDSWIGEYATSLRMSNIGYTNPVQSHLNISYNTLTDYVAGLKHATSTKEPRYEAFGIKNAHGEYQQLNENILQIEAEFYSAIRPKRKAQANERPLHALATKGIHYIEVRALDLNPFEKVGISTQDLHFLELFLIYCLLTKSPTCSNMNCQSYRENKLSVAYEGRKPGLMLSREGKMISLVEWMEECFHDLLPIATWLDEQDTQQTYQKALAHKYQQAQDFSQLPSAQLLALMEKENASFIETALLLSEQQKATLTTVQLSESRELFFKRAAATSLQDQAQIEKNDTLPFDKYLENYLNSV